MLHHQIFIGFDRQKYQHHYLCHYIPKSAGSDDLSRSLISFKRGIPLHVDTWVECTAEELRKSLYGWIYLILRILSSEELFAKSRGISPMNHLGRTIGSTLKSIYLPELLHKKRSVKKLKFLNSNERFTELEGVYTFTRPPAGFSFNRILIIDDILTTGATMCSAISAIREEMPDIPIQLFTLATTQYQGASNPNLKIPPIPYLWESEGLNKVAESGISYLIPSLLKQKILKDSW